MTVHRAEVVERTRRQVVDDVDAAAELEQQLDEVRTDEAGAARHHQFALRQRCGDGSAIGNGSRTSVHAGRH